MKKIIILFVCIIFCVIFFCVFLAKPSREQALSALRNQDTVWQSIRTADSFWVNEIYLPTLVNNGMVQLNRDAIDSIGRLINFTTQAFPYFLPTSEQEKAAGIQRVFVAKAALIAVIKVQRLFPTDVVFVDYVVEYRNLSPFADLSKMRAGDRDTVSMQLHRSDGVWKVDQNNF